MGEIRIVGPGKRRGYPYPVCKKHKDVPIYILTLISYSYRFTNSDVFIVAKYEYIGVVRPGLGLELIT